jgi:hypothetical protein
MNPKRIVIDGKTYNSVDEMPEDVRRKYEEAMRGFQEFSPQNISGAIEDVKNIFADKDRNGIPDVLEGNPVINLAGGMKFVVDGQTYNSMDELPPEARAKYEQAMGSMDKNRNGVPDFLEGAMNVSAQDRPPAPVIASPRTETPRPPTRMTGSPAITPDTSSGWMLIVGVALLFFLCLFGAVGAWYFFLR